MSLWFCTLPLLPNSIPWLVGWLVHSLGQHPPQHRASSFNPTRPLDSQALSYLGLYYINHTLDCTHKKNSLLWKACPILAATIHLWLWLSHHPSHIHPAHSSGSSCTVGSTFCFDCWPCLLVHCRGYISAQGGWPTSHRMQVRLIQLWTAVCMYLWLSGALFCVFIVVMTYLLPLHYTCMCWGAEGRGNACTAVMQNCGWLHNYYVFPPFGWGGGSVFISTCMRNTEKGWSVSKSYDSGTWHCMHLDISCSGKTVTHLSALFNFINVLHAETATV